MNPHPLPPPAYDRRTLLLHWASAAVVLLLWGSSQLIDLFPRGPARYPMRSTHLLLGVLFAGLLAYRLWWRAMRGSRAASSDPAWAQRASRALHGLLYALLAAEVLLGLGNAWVRGDHVFTLFQIPAFDPGNTALRRQVGGLHQWTGHAILALACLHAAAALFHQHVLRDDRLRRMLPRFR